MLTNIIIERFIEKIEADGKQGKDLTLYYVISILREILSELNV